MKVLHLFLLITCYAGVVVPAWQLGDECPSTIVSSVPADGDMFDRDMFGTKNTFGDLPSVYLALKSCPHVVSLDLVIREQSGCVIGFEQRSLDIQPGDTFAALKELKLYGYDFSSYNDWSTDRQRWYKNQWYSPSGEEYEQQKDPIDTAPQYNPSYQNRHIDRWLQAINWSSLKVLEVDEPSDELFAGLAGKLLALSRLKVVGGGPRSIWYLPPGHEYIPHQKSSTIDFIRSVADNGVLTSLAMIGADDVQIEDVVAIGPQLARLRHLEWTPRLAQYEGYHVRRTATEEEVMVTASQLKTLVALLPKVQHLTMTIYYGSEFGTILDVLSSMQALNSLDLKVITIDGGREANGNVISDLESDHLLDSIHLFHNSVPSRMPPTLSAKVKLVEEIFVKLRVGKHGEELQRLRLHVHLTGEVFSCSANHNTLASDVADIGFCRLENDWPMHGTSARRVSNLSDTTVMLING